MLTKRERVLRTARFQETDRTPVYDILQNEAVIEHYAAEILRGQPLSPANGAVAKGFAIGRVLDMTRMPEAPAAPGVVRQENGILLQVEPWTSWIIERPFHDIPETIAWVEAEIRRTNNQRFDAAYREQFQRWLDDCAALFAAGDPTGREDPTVQVIELGRA